MTKVSKEISQYMSKIGKKSGKKKTREHFVMMGKKSGEKRRKVIPTPPIAD